MLKTLRKKGFAKKILWVIAVVVIISFGFFGKASLLNDNPQSFAGKIFGKKVSIQEFEKVLRQVQIQAIIYYGEDFKKIKSAINLESETWNRLILLHEIKKRKIKIDDQEVVDLIEQYPFFQRDGQFDSLLYNNTLRYAFRVKPREFEESMRNTLKINKLKEMQTNDIILNDNDIFNKYKTQKERAQITYVLITPEQFKNDVTFEETYLQQYYEKNKKHFLKPPSIKVDYIKMDFPEKEKTKKDKEGSLEERPSTSDEEYAVIDKMETIYQDLLDDPNIQKIAKKHDTTIETTDYFSMEEPIFTFGSFDALNKIFALEQGEISSPLETTSSMYIVKAKEKREAYIPEYEEAYSRVKKTVQNNEAKRIAKEKSKELLKRLQDHLNKAQVKNFSIAAKEMGLQIRKTPVFSRGQYLPVIGIAKNFQETAFSLNEKNKLSGVVPTEKGYCILYLDSYMPIDQNEYQEEKETFAAEMMDEKRMQKFNDYFARLKIEANLVNKLKKEKNEKM